MHVITISNLQGGVGKTSIAFNMAAGLARRSAARSQGGRVLLLDMDPQGNALKGISDTTQWADVESLTSAIADDDLLNIQSIQRRPLRELVRQAPSPWYPTLYFVPFREVTMVEVRRRAAHPDAPALMRNAFDSLRDDFDYIVVDTPPNTDDWLYNIFAATDFIIVPVEMDEDAIQGASRITQLVTTRFGRAGRPRIIGYVSNKVVPRRLGDRSALSGLEQLFGELLFPVSIPTSIDIRYSKAIRRDIYAFAPDSPAALAMAQLVEETLRRIKRREDRQSTDSLLPPDRKSWAKSA